MSTNHLVSSVIRTVSMMTDRLSLPLTRVRQNALCWLFLACLGLTLFASAVASAVSFSFTLASACRTSAAVYKTDGTMVRTLWSNVSYGAGTFTETWDGVDDFGCLAPDGSYQVKVASSNTSYVWEGVIGNTSASWSGATVFHSYDVIRGMAISGTNAYYTVGYPEGGQTAYKFQTTSPQSTRAKILSKGAENFYIATDGTNVYWAGSDPNTANDSFVYGTSVANDSEVTFANGQAVQTVYGRLYSSAIDVITGTVGAEATGIAVQGTGSYLFVAHKGLNQVNELNKTTGALVRTLAFTEPTALATDGSNRLWVGCTVGGVPVVQRYTVAGDGTITLDFTVNNGFSSVIGLGISPDNTTMVMADGGTSQQLKAYSVANGTYQWTYGVAGGYTTDATVANDKFMFGSHTFIAFQSDGSFWVGDYGNARVQHFSSARAFINRVMALPHSYSSSVDPNDPTRAFSDKLEFAIDYALPLGPENGSWTLVRNWAGIIPTGYDNQYKRMYCTNTLSNGHTYSLIWHSSTSKFAIFELTSSATLRNTGIEVGAATFLAKDGSLYSVNSPAVGGTVTWTKQALTGFDSMDNPTWATATTLASAPAAATDPVWWGDTNHARAGSITNSNIVVSFDHKNDDANHGWGWHLGGVAVGGTNWLWRASLATAPNYNGDYPLDGAFDIGNGVKNAGGNVLVVDNNIFYDYYGEFWKASQTNMWAHYNDHGLLLGMFGALNDGTEAPEGMAGNGFSCWVVKLDDGRVYIYHADEFTHSGLHRWRVDNLDSIAEQTINITLASDKQNGLNGEYFDTADWNNFTRVTTRLDSQVNFNWGTNIPTATAISSADTYSVRWSGFVQPQYSETYTFTLTSDDWARLWVNGKKICEGTGAQSGTIALTADTRYPIKVEYRQDTSTASITLQWSSASLTQELIPASRLCCISTGTDLMDGLPSSGALVDGTAGWNRNPTTNDTNYWTYWTVNNQTDNNNPYVFTTFRSNVAVTKTVTRVLDTPSSTTNSWELSANVSYPGNYPNHGTTGGQYLDILDDAGLVIARFYPRQITSPSDYRIYANTVQIWQGTSTNIHALMDIWQPLRVYARNGQVTFQYANCAPVTTTVFDVNSDWRRPTTLKMSFFCTTSQSYLRKIGIDGMRFSKTQSDDAMNLLDNLKYNSMLEDSAYGWTRNPTTDSTVSGETWQFDTNYGTYDRVQPDLYMKYRKNTAGVVTATRDLGTPTGTATRWTFTANVNYVGNYPNHGTNGGQYLEVLDDAGRVISRFYSIQVGYPNDFRIYGNTSIIAQNTQTVIKGVMSQWQPLTISAENGQVTFAYAGYTPVTNAVFDSAADWQRPKTFRLYDWTSGTSYDRKIDIKSATFSVE